MAATKIADVIVPELFNPYVIQRSNELSALVAAGVVQTVPDMNLGGLKGGTTLAMPFWNDLSGAEEVLSDTTPLGVDKITSGQDIAVLHTRGKAWGVNDLAKALAGSDPMAAIGDLVGDYWARRRQVMLISELKGIFASASMSGLVADISGNTGDAAVAGAETFVDAAFKLGDAQSKLTAIAIHSAVLGKFVKDDLIEYVADSEGKLTIPTYLGKRVIVDDGMPTSGGVYTSYLFGEGAIGYADANAPVPTETDRDSLQGEDILINRQHFIFHPRGVKWVGTSTGVSPTNLELENGSNWTRVFDVKSLRIVQWKHKIA